MINISNFISSLEKYSVCNVTLSAYSVSLDLAVYHSKNTKSGSYLLAFQPQTQNPIAIIPITTKLSIRVSDSTMIMKFDDYSGITLIFTFQNLSDFQVFVSDIVNCASKDPVKDEFRDLNNQFLYRFQSNQDQVQSTMNNSVSFADPFTFPRNPGSVAVNIQQRSIWERQCMEQNSQFAASLEDLRLSVITWNVASVKPHPIVIEEINRAFQCGNEKADCVFISLQEIDMGVISIVAGSTTVSSKWSEIVEAAVQRSGGEYEVAMEESLGGVYTAVIVRSASKFKLRINDKKTIRLGVYGMAANKGAIVYYCSVACTKFVIIGCHLSPHTENWQQRNEQIRQLLKYVKGSYDYLIIAGDMNYRIALPYEETLSLISQNKIGALVEHDQLKMTLQRDEMIGKLKEPPLQFMPTYKFDKNSSIYDTSPKKRVPSWTDRILVKRSAKRLSVGTSNEPVLDISKSGVLNYPTMPKCHAFRRGTCQFSDHRSVTCSFSFKVLTVDNEKVELIKKAITNYYNSIEEDITPKIELSSTTVPTNGGKITIKNKSRSWVRWSADTSECNMNISTNKGFLFPEQQTEIDITSSSGSSSGNIIFAAEHGNKVMLNVTNSGDSVQKIESPSFIQFQQEDVQKAFFNQKEEEKSIPIFDFGSESQSSNSIMQIDQMPQQEEKSQQANMFNPFFGVPQPQQAENVFDPFGFKQQQQQQQQSSNNFDPFGIKSQNNTQNGSNPFLIF